MCFYDKVVIVTGASSGIGAATALMFAKKGATVVIVGRNETKLEQISSNIGMVGNLPLVIKADVSKEEEVQMIINKTIDSYGKIDVLVNNAGFLKNGSLLGGNILEAYDVVMATNLRAILHLTSLAVPHLIKTKGNIVNISSIGGISTPTESNWLPYCISKAALNHFSNGAAFELAGHGVRVNTVSPGPVATDFAINGNMGFNDIRDLSAYTPLKRVSESEEIADIILFLASDKARGITGSNFVCDNGLLLGAAKA